MPYDVLMVEAELTRGEIVVAVWLWNDGSVPFVSFALTSSLSSSPSATTEILVGLFGELNADALVCCCWWWCAEAAFFNSV